MREFGITIDKVLRKGLRTDYRDSRNTGQLVELVNLKPTEYGLAPFEPIQIPFSAQDLDAYVLEWDFPFPQLFRGSNTIFLAARNRLFEVDPASWGLNQFITYDADNTSSEKSIPIGRQWTFVDFGYSWFAFNGMCVVFFYNKEGLFGGSNKILVDTKVRAETGSLFKGRLLMGGFDEDYSWSSAWKSFWQDLADDSSITFDLTLELKANQILYSSIGGGDLSWLHIKSDGTDGYVGTDQGASETPYDSNDPLVIDWNRKGDRGIVTVESQGLVRKILTLGNLSLAYCDDGVFALIPYANELVSGFGSKRVCNSGIANTGAVAGDERTHVFVDSSGFLWKVTGEEFKRLGYKEFFEPMLGNEIIVSYDVNLNEFFICDDNSCFVLNKLGLYETTQLITSTIYENGEVLGIGIDEDYINRTAKFTIGSLDYNVRGVKTLYGVEVNGRINCDSKVYYDYKFDKSSNFVRTPGVMLNKEGVAALTCGGIEHRVHFEFDDFESVELTQLEIKRKYTDKRYIRGSYAGKITS